jgi:hypothetical protein
LYGGRDGQDLDLDCRGLIERLDNSAGILDLYQQSHLWSGCFGVMSVISHDFLSLIATKYGLFKLLNYVTDRSKRMALERVFGVICYQENKLSYRPTIVLFGNIFRYNWGFTYDEYLKIKDNKNNFPLIKVWTGR